jgi:uncharacterized repeat protein (TIGR01451 family)/MYXO-CTERM domain-containing protein
VSNSGPGAADNLVVTDTLPAGVSFVSAVGSGWSCANAGGTVTCTRASLAAAATAPISIAVTAPLTAGSISNSATVKSDQPDPNSANNTATATTSVLLPAKLTATKTFASTRIVGEAVTYTIVMTNSGGVAQNDNAGNELTDVLPAQVTLVSATATAGTAVATIGSNTVTWNGSLAVGASVTITINGTIAPGTAGQTPSNQGTLSYDSNLDNTNDASALTDDPGVGGAADPTSFVVLAVVCGDGRVSAGEQCDDGNTTANDCCSPSCQFESTTTVCRPAAGVCDVADTCNGAGQCGADTKAADGTPCPNSTVCDGAEVCKAGVCTAGTALSCDDGDPCTQDTCNATSGCMHAGMCGADMAGTNGGADMSGSGTDGGAAPDMGHGGGGSGCSCELGGAQPNRAPALLATSLLVGLFGWRRRRRSRG